MITTDNTCVTIDKLISLKCHQTFKLPKTQIDFYKENNAHIEILKYVELTGKSFGEKYMEALASEYFNLCKRESSESKSGSGSGHDHTKNSKRIEQKSARYHACGGDWKWQHIEMKHAWDYLLLCGLDFQDIKYYIASRTVVEKLINEGVIVGQGKKVDGVAQPQQAYWFSRSDFKKHNKLFSDYFVMVRDESELIQYLNEN